MTRAQRHEKYMKIREAQIAEIMKDVVSITPDIEIYNGRGVICSEWRYDGVPVSTLGLWMHKKSEKKWGLNRTKGWVWYDEDEVTIPEGLLEVQREWAKY